MRVRTPRGKGELLDTDGRVRLDSGEVCTFKRDHIAPVGWWRFLCWLLTEPEASHGKRCRCNVRPG